jgi:hypothetical protein
MNQLNHDIMVACTWILLSVNVPNDMMPIEFKENTHLHNCQYRQRKKGIKGKTIFVNNILHINYVFIHDIIETTNSKNHIQ